jgi:hypothetical protein
MNKQLLTFASIFTLFILISCGSNDEKKLDTQEKKAVEEQINKDQLAMDSLEKAIQAQIDAVPDDSLSTPEKHNQ